MTPEQKIKHLILLKDRELLASYGDEREPLPEITAANIDDIFEESEQEEPLYDGRSEVRSSYDCETDIPCESSRHYESKSVATQYVDGSWVGWTYWYGGGKHGEPEEVDWIEYAYDLNCTEEQKMVTVRTFEKAETP